MDNDDINILRGNEVQQLVQSRTVDFGACMVVGEFGNDCIALLLGVCLARLQLGLQAKVESNQVLTNRLQFKKIET